MQINPATFSNADFPRPTGAASAVHWIDYDENTQLREALFTAASATQWIPAEQERLRLLREEAQSDKEREARDYQIWYVAEYLTRAEDLARTRLKHFATLRTEGDFKRELASLTPENWFEFYAFGYDPRARTKLDRVPFGLFPKQSEMVRWLDDLVFRRRTSGLIEKSRDEGATETMVRWGLYHWLFTAGFSMLLSTRKEDEVDAKKNQNTLFERVRYQIRLLPDWMLPENFDRNRDMMATMKLANPANGNTLLGEAPVPNMGRGGRVTCAMLDEFAFWQFGGYPQFRSLSQTTDSILMPSSVGGRLNQYADIAFDGVTPKFVLDWRQNPLKDKRWYDSLPFGFVGPKMTATTIAQEVDRNYDAAQPGKVWHIPEPHVFITMSEFLRPFEMANLGRKFRDENGRFRIPEDWRIVETHDYGKSEGHDWGFLIGAQPRASYPLNDTHFIFIARNLEPTGLSTEDAVKQWRGFERDLGMRVGGKLVNAPYMRYHSHEQFELRKVLRDTYGESWIAWDTNYVTGLETVEEWLTLQDKGAPNPFRPEIYGRTKLVFVAPDDEYELAFDPDNGKHYVTIAKTEAGFATARKQMAAYHYPQTELGKAKKDMRPAKEFDDVVDCLVAGTLVKTRRGERPIESICVGDDVWTRSGYRKVLAAGLSLRDAPTMTITAENGRSITLTGNHRVMTLRGFVRAENLNTNDYLYLWQDRKLLNSTASRFIGIPIPSVRLISAISTRMSAIAEKVFSLFMSRFGRPQMDLCPSAATSITAITTTTTTSCRISNALQAKTITSSTPKSVPSDLVSRNMLRISQEFGRSPKRGIRRMKVGDGIASTVRNNGQIGLNGSALATIVAKISSRKRTIKSSARSFANGVNDTASLFKRLLNRASIAALNLRWRLTPNSERPNGFVTATALTSIVTNRDRADVYNLTVAGRPEYFANDILVHNCLRGYAVNWNRKPAALTDSEEIDARMPDALRSFNLIPEGQTSIPAGRQIARIEEEARIRRELGFPENPMDAFGDDWGGW